MYNSYNLETTFRKYLQSKNRSPATIKNYLSDYRHFNGWLLLKLKQTDANISEFYTKLPKYLTVENLKQYKYFLIVNNVCSTTINRRLASLRAFVTHCQKNNWVANNPMATIHNVTIVQQYTTSSHIQFKKAQQKRLNEIINNFRKHLKQKQVSPGTTRSYISDINQFLTWTAEQKIQ